MANIIKSFTSFSLPAKIVVILVIFLFLILPITLYAVKMSSNTIIPIPQNGIAKPTLIPFPSKEQYVEGQLIINYQAGMGPKELKDSARVQTIQDLFKKEGVISQEKVYKDNTDMQLKNFYLLHFSPGVDIESAAQRIYSLPEIKGAEPNVEATILNK